MSLKRLYVFTGKGGVGKTTTALSFYKALSKQGHKCILLDFVAGEHDQVIKEKGIDHKRLDQFESVEIYIGRKLNSKTLAKWIVSTSFFRALIKMIPGFSYLIFLGHMLDMLKAAPELTIILDSPSTGHALTMLEAANNYKKIFKSGVLFDDIQKMLNFSSETDVMQINICLIPTEMACQEGAELSEKLKSIGFQNQKIYMNFYLPLSFSNIGEQLPEFLENKVQNEKIIQSEFESLIDTTIPYVFNSSPTEVQNQIIDLVMELK